jgi:type I restriction enzyme S subunit
LGLEHLDPGNLTVARFGSEVAPIGEKLIMKKGDVLFGKRRAYQKKVAIAPFDGIFSAHGMVLRPKEQIINKDFFPLFISSDYFLDAAIKISVGSLSPTINWSVLKELEFELPSISQQQQLSKILWAAIEAKNAYKTLLLLTEQLVKSQFVEMFGDPAINPNGFSIVNLEDIAEIVSGVAKGRKLPKEQIIQVPYMRVANVKDGSIDLSEIKLIDATMSELGRYRLIADDVLMTEGGDPDKLGRGAIWKNEIEDCIHQNHIFRVRLNQKTITPVFFAEYLKQQYTKAYFLSCSKQTTGIASINMTQLKATPTILPPLDLQHRFADFVRQTDKLKFAA